MRKIFEFGKINYYGKRKVNLVTVEVELYIGDNFTASANIWNSKKTDIIRGGQCLDTIYQFKEELQNKELFEEIYYMWKNYHLNDCRPGSKKQCHVISLLSTVAHINDYHKQIEFLKKHNLYEHEGRIYGKTWYKDEIPAEDLNRIKEILGL